MYPNCGPQTMSGKLQVSLMKCWYRLAGATELFALLLCLRPSPTVVLIQLLRPVALFV